MGTGGISLGTGGISLSFGMGGMGGAGDGPLESDAMLDGRDVVDEIEADRKSVV